MEDSSAISGISTLPTDLSQGERITSTPVTSDSTVVLDITGSPIRSAASACRVCGALLNAASDRCYTCGSDIGAPNVREASTPEERSALRSRYSQAAARAYDRGMRSTFRDFEQAVNTSGVVVNCTLWFLKEFVSQSKALYANYHQAVFAGIRKAAIPANDQRRSVVDALLFRSYAPGISFGALSVTNRGVLSYGLYSMRLRDVSISHRTSVLEENSFDFVARHQLNERTSIPPGYRTDWSKRAQLAASKLEPHLQAGLQAEDFRKLLLSSDGNYTTDRFIEAHIFGSFDFGAVDSISGPLPETLLDRAIWESVKEDATAAGKRVDEWHQH